jgi:hypothetical protein
MKWQLTLSVSLVTFLSANALSLAQTPPPASPESAPEKIDRLQKDIEGRDALIRDLVTRIDRLEGRQAKRRSNKPTTTTAGGPAPPREPPPQVAQQSLPPQQSTEPGAAKPAPPQAPAPQVAQQSPPSSQQSTGAAGPTSAPPAQPAQSTAPGGVAAASPGPQLQSDQQSPPSSPQSTQQTPGDVGEGPGTFSVSAEAAQHALERALVQSGAALLTPWTVELVPSVTYQYSNINLPGQIAISTTGNVLITNEVVRSTLVQPSMLLRSGLPWDSQVQFSVPYDYRAVANTTRILTTGVAQSVTSQTGVGDPTLTLTKQVLSEAEWRPNVFISGTWEQSFDQYKNGIPLGSGFDEFSVGLTATKRQDPLVFTGGFLYQKTLTNKGITPGDQFTPSVGMLFAVSPETSLQLAQQVSFVNATKRGNQIIPGSDELSAVFSVGVLSILAPGWVVNLTAGIGETADAPNLTVQLSLPIRLN